MESYFAPIGNVIAHTQKKFAPMRNYLPPTWEYIKNVKKTGI
jgi:hypothetical protein